MPAAQQQQQQRQQQQQQQQQQPDQTDDNQPAATSDWEPIVDETQILDDWLEDEDYEEEATGEPAAAPAAAAAPAPAKLPEATPGGGSATGVPSNPVPFGTSAAQVQSIRVATEAGPSGRPEVIPVQPLSAAVPSHNGQRPLRRRRQRMSPAAVPAIMPLTEVLPEQQAHLQGQSVKA
ncbi:hypothetical protein COO60DRAFT_1514691 [Scenedesmus sp. NREL 46B-D3]|nr:hypothetical protein COO60DRAFT_1514691 [Scenedesmus sp. NREL 46B-D3]